MYKKMKNSIENLQSSFEGYVNGEYFTNQKDMEKFIGECLANGTPITELSYSTQYKNNSQPVHRRPTRKGVEAIEEAQKNTSWISYLHDITPKVPNPYTNIINYLVPFVNEDITITVHNSDTIITHFKDKLSGRMEFFEKYILKEIRTWKYSDIQVNAWLQELMSKFDYKLKWATNRMDTIKPLAGSDDAFITNNIDMIYFCTFYTIYTETIGFCEAMKDIIRSYMSDCGGCGCGCGACE